MTVFRFGIAASATVLLAGSLFTPQMPAQQLAPDSDVVPAAAPKRPVSFDLSALDRTVDPCTDFYRYSCGNWLKNNPIPPSESRWGRFNELADRNLYLLYTELRSAADHPTSPLQIKYGNFYAACMNTTRIEPLGAKPLAPELAEIAKLDDKRKIARLDILLIGLMGGSGGSELLHGLRVTQDQKDSTKQILSVGQGGLGLPDRDYYLLKDDRSATLRKQYVEHVTKMFALLGDTPGRAAAEAADVMRIETALAQGSMTRVDRRDPAKTYHIMTVAEVEKLNPDYDWSTLLASRGVSNAGTLNVSSPGYVKAVNEVIEAEPLPALKSYLRWQVVHNAAPYLSAAFVDENFNFFAHTLNGQQEQQPRWKRCTRLTDAALGEAVGQDWVKQNFPPDAKANMEKLVDALRKALEEDIQTLPWMGPDTKKQAEAKLAAFRQKIGYPERWRDYTTLSVSREDLLGDLERASAFEHRRDLDKLGKPVDEREWGMTPPTVNAYYSASNNDINFPAGILQPPFFDNTLDPAVNFGGIGVVIGHEMTHGFDDQGSKFGPTGNVKYNADGSLGGWFTKADLKQFNDRTSCVADEYSGFKVAEGQNLNGKLTLGENTADNGGIRIAYQALMETLAEQAKTAPEVRDGFTPAQRFFISFGQIWCENRTDQSARNQAKTDPHSTGEWRVDGTVRNFDAFGKAFGCKTGQAMMPEKSCRVW